MRRTWLVLLLILMGTGAAAAEHLEPVSWIGGVGGYGWVHPRGDHLYAVSERGRLEIFRWDGQTLTRRWAGPFRESGCRLHPFAGELVISGSWSQSLEVHSVRDPIGLDRLGTLEEIHPIETVAVPPYLYCSAGGEYEGQLLVVNLEDPSRPRLAGSMMVLGQLRALRRAGEHLLIVDDAGLRMVGIQDRTRPRLMGTFRPPDSYYNWNAVLVEDDLALMEIPDQWLVLDLTDPWTPTPLGRLDLPGEGLLYRNGRLYLSDYVSMAHYSLRIYDLTAPLAPVLLSETDLTWQPDRAWLEGLLLILADDRLRGFDVSNPAAPAPAFERRGVDGLRNVFAGDGYLAVERVGDEDRLELYGGGDPDWPVLLASIAGGHRCLTEAGGLLVLVGEDDRTLEILDVSDPSTPLPVSVLILPDQFDKATYQDGFLYLADTIHQSLQVVDLRIPATPLHTASRLLAGRADALLATEEALYVGTYLINFDHQLEILDRSVPDDPVPVEVLPLGDRPNRPGAVVNGRLLLHDFGSLVEIYDMTDPLGPVFEQGIEVPGGSEISIQGSRMARCGDHEVQAYDLARLPRIDSLGSYGSPIYLDGAAVAPAGRIWAFEGEIYSGGWSLIGLRASPLPMALMAGWVDTGDQWVVLAWTAHSGIRQMELTWDGLDTGVYLAPTSAGWFSLALETTPEVPPGRYLLGLRGEGTNLWRPAWPHLEVR